MNRRLAPWIAVLMLAIAGCNGEKAPVIASPIQTGTVPAKVAEANAAHAKTDPVGVWQFKSLDLSAINVNEMALATQRGLQNTTITFSPDKHYWVSGTVDEKGDWSVEGNAVILTMTSLGNKTMSQKRKEIAALLRKEPKLAASLGKVDLLGPKTISISSDGHELRIKSKVPNGSDQIYEKAGTQHPMKTF